MSMNAASPKTSDVCAGDSPTWSAHKGRRDWRAVREAPSTTTDVPMVSSTNRCRFITLHTDGCWSGAGPRLRREIGHGQGKQAGEQGSGRRQHEHGRDPADVDQSSPQERPDEEPDPHAAAERRQGSGSVRRGHHVDHESLSGLHERRPEHAAQGYRDTQHQDGSGTGGQQHRGRVRRTRDDQRASFADPGDDRPRGEARTQLADAHQRDHERRRTDVGSQFAGAEGDHGHGRPVADGVHERRAVRHPGDVTEPKRGLAARLPGHPSDCGPGSSRMSKGQSPGVAVDAAGLSVGWPLQTLFNDALGLWLRSAPRRPSDLSLEGGPDINRVVDDVQILDPAVRRERRHVYDVERCRRTGG